MMVDNDYTKLGKNLKVFAILTLVTALLGLLEDFVIPAGFSISGFVSVPLLVFQIFIIISAKKSAKAYNKPELNTFASLMIASLVLSFASVGVIFGMTFFEVFNAMMGGGPGTINIMPVMVAAEVISLITISFEAIAWSFMLVFLAHLEVVDAGTHGKPGAILAMVGSIIAIVSSLVVGIPVILMNPTIDIDNIQMVMTPLQGVTSALFSIGKDATSIIGFFILSAVFIQLGSVNEPSVKYTAGSNAVPWGDLDPSRSPPPAGRDWTERPMNDVPVGTASGKCPFCGSSLVSGDPRAGFCGECGAKLPGRV